jgi:hypothetical protein
LGFFLDAFMRADFDFFDAENTSPINHDWFTIKDFQRKSKKAFVHSRKPAPNRLWILIAFLNVIADFCCTLLLIH